MKEYNFGWGVPYFLLQILHKMYPTQSLLTDVEDMSYSPDNGFPLLIAMTKDVIYQTTGKTYKYVGITNGATGALSAILQYYRSKGKRMIVADKYNYPFYEDMVKNSAMNIHKIERPWDFDKDNNTPHVSFVIASPSNPLGKIYGHDFSGVQGKRTTWDAVYHNKIYMKDGDLGVTPDHEFMVGSYSKLLGLTGIRIGWIASNDKDKFDAAMSVSLKQNATISVPSQFLVMSIIDSLDLEVFMIAGNRDLNYNRESFQKLEYLFDGQRVQETGMFYCAHAEKGALKLLKECNISYIDLGDNFIRLSMGQTLDITSEGVRVILRKDGKL